MVVHENYLKAGNPDTPIEELRNLFFEQDHKVRRRLAENPRTPPDILSRLAGDEHPDVRIAVAENPETPREVLENLASDDNVYVRFALAGHYNLPMDMLEKFAEEDENPYVRDHAYRTLQGLYLEEALQEADFVQTPGEADKLGELLVNAEVLGCSHIEELLRIAQEREIPLGRAIVQTRALPREVVVVALKAQNKLRRGECNHHEAHRQIKHAWATSAKTTN